MQAFAFQNVHIFDGMNLLSANTVIVQDGFITAVGTDLACPVETQVVNGTGYTLLPGFIDAHTHVFLSEDYELQQALHFGVTTELDMFMDIHVAQIIKQQQAQGRRTQWADLYSAGTCVTVSGGHGTEYGIPIPTIQGPEEAQAFVDARLLEGSDYIKLIYDDYSSYGRKVPTISKETMAAVVKAAHNRGKRALAHIASLQAARDALESGVDGLAHLFVDTRPDPHFARFVAEHHAFVVPTLTMLESLCGTPGGASLVDDMDLAPSLFSDDIKALQGVLSLGSHASFTYAAAEESVRALQLAGVPLLAGTDAPNPGTIHGASIHRELELLVQAGLTPIEALRAATSVPAECFALRDRGQIAVGRRADLLLVKGDPTTNIRATRALEGIWKHGVLFDRQAYIIKYKRQQHTTPPSSALKYSISEVISDFEAGTLQTRFGEEWSTSTDALRGGTSTAEIKVVPDGVNGGKGSLLIRGNIAHGVLPWAGAIWYCGETPQTPADFSGKRALTFWTKGENRSYRVMFIAGNPSTPPVTVTFLAGQEWQQVTVLFSDLRGIEVQGLLGVIFTGGPEEGPFTFQIDDVCIS